MITIQESPFDAVEKMLFDETKRLKEWSNQLNDEDKREWLDAIYKMQNVLIRHASKRSYTNGKL